MGYLTLEERVRFLERIVYGRWVIEGETVTVYDEHDVVVFNNRRQP